MRSLLLAVIALAMGMSLNANGAIVSQDLAAPGDGLLTYDTINKRQWLDLPETTGISLTEVMSEMAPGGKLEGFRFATLADVSELAASAGVGWTAWKLPFSPEPRVNEFVELIGWVVQLTGGLIPDIDLALGLIARHDTSGMPSFDNTNFMVISTKVASLPIPGIGLEIVYEPGGGVLTSGPITWLDPPRATGDIGPFWLYRNIPEPGAAALIAQILTGITAVRRFEARTVH